MFKQHQKEIAQYAMCGPDQTARVITFVYLTIQQPINTIPEAMRDVLRQGSESRYLWGFKLGAYEWLEEHREEVYRILMDTRSAHADPRASEIATLSYLATLPGLGLVKAGFVNQLVFGQTGCIDTHNVNRFGVNPRFLRADMFKRATATTRRAKAEDYVDMCIGLGGAEKLWDGWCEYVAAKQGTTSHKISELHVDSVLQ